MNKHVYIAESQNDIAKLISNCYEDKRKLNFTTKPIESVTVVARCVEKHVTFEVTKDVELHNIVHSIYESLVNCFLTIKRFIDYNEYEELRFDISISLNESNRANMTEIVLTKQSGHSFDDISSLVVFAKKQCFINGNSQ